MTAPDMPVARPHPIGCGRATWPENRCLALAGQLVAQGREGLVRGQRATWLAGVGRGGRGGRATAGTPAGAGAGGAAGRGRLSVAALLGLGPRLLDLAAVRLEARARLGVLALPLLALGLVARQPLAGLRVEALGVLVVAPVVVGRGHAVQGRVEVVADRLADRALAGLLER